jgi:DNA-binding transcriptional LysR family regulator
MDTVWFKSLENLGKTGNFSQAAELSNVSQPAFSRRIKALEHWVGAILVDRSRHPVKLTDAGSQMLEAGLQAISRIEVERKLVREALSQPDRYVVTFATQHSIGWRFYPTWLQALENAFGPIMSRLRADDLPNCIDDLKKGEVDFVIAYQSDFSPSMKKFAALESIKIGRDRLVPVCKCGPDGGTLFDIDDPAQESIPYLRFGATAPIGRHVEPLLRARGIEPRLRVVYENSMAGALRVRARDGAGVAWLPQSLVQPDLASGLLTLAGAESWAIGLEIRLHRLNLDSNPLTRKLWTFLALREGVPLTTN